MKPILVSAFLHNKQHYQTADFYKQYGTQLLQMNQRKIIFMDENLLSAFSEYQNENTKIISIKKLNFFFLEFGLLLILICSSSELLDINSVLSFVLIIFFELYKELLSKIGTSLFKSALGGLLGSLPLNK